MKRICAVLCIITVMISGCGGKKTYQCSRDIFAMDTYMNLKAYGDNADKAVDKAQTEIVRIERLLSVTDKNSDTYAVNNSNGTSVEVHEDVSRLIEYAVSISGETDRCLDITIYPVLKEWGFTTGEYKIPDEKRISELLKNVDCTKIALNGNKITLPKDAELDFGAVAKGYTSDRVMEIFRENGVDSAVISLGGNVQTIGKKPDGSVWNVAVTDPFNPTDSLGILTITDKAVVTSGSYERYFTGDDGKKYCHIIDPETGRPTENGLISVTVIGESGLMCDALSTAFFIMGKEKTETYWQSHNNFDMVLVDEDGNIFITEGIENAFENMSSLDMEVLHHES